MNFKKVVFLSCISSAILLGNESVLEQIQIDETKINDPIEGRKNSSSTKIIVSKEEIGRFADQSVGDILKRLPGLSFTGPAGYVEDIRFRGSDKGYTQILIDGEPIADGKKERQFQVSRLSADMIERIEIIKQTTSEYNSDGIAGTINIILKDPPKSGKGDYSLRYGFSDGEPIKEVYLNYGNKLDKWSYIIGLNAIERPLVKPKPTVETAYDDNAANAAKSIKTGDELEMRTNSELSLMPKLIYHIDDHSKLTLSGYFISGEEDKTQDKTATEDTVAPLGTLNGADKTVVTNVKEVKDRINNRFLAKYEIAPSANEKYSVTAMINQGGEEKDKSTLTRSTVVGTGVTTVTNATEYEKIKELEKKIKTDGSFVLGDSNFVKIGLEYSMKDFDSKKTSNGAITSSPSDQLDMQENSWQAYIVDEYMVNSDHILTPGLRIESFTQTSLHQGDEKEGDYRFVNPSLHYLWHLTEDINLRASIARKVRKPKFDEIYNGVKSGTGTSVGPFEVGNLDLKPEISLGYELGLEHFFAQGTGVVGVNAYYRDIDDKTEDQTTQRSDGNYYKTKVNAGKAKLYGIEFDASKDIKEYVDGLRIYGNLSFMNGKLKDSSTGLERGIKDVPEYALNLGFDQKIPALDVTVGAAYNYLAGFDVYESPTKRSIEDPRGLLDVYVLKKINKSLDLRLSAKNITEVEKNKKAIEYAAASGRVTKITTEKEESRMQIFASFEGKF